MDRADATPWLPAESLTDSDRDDSLRDILAQRKPGEPVWVFAYGSLIWRPEFEYDAKVCGIVHGFHRSLCLWSRVYRGTPNQPGLVLGLEPGGSVRGVAFRLEAQSVRESLEGLWRREMVTGSYTPRWLRVRPIGGSDTTPRLAIGFVMNCSASGYARNLDRQTLLATLRTARGARGTSAEYLLATVRGLAEHGIHDQHLEALAREVGMELFNPLNLAV